MKKYSFSILLIFLLGFGCDIEKKEYPEIITLENENLKVSLATHLGGRLIFFGSPGGANVLRVKEKTWTDDSPFTPKDSLKISFVGYDGMITWLGPQSNWWTQQETVPELKNQKAIWPPDPFIIYGEFQVMLLNDSSVSLIGSHSCVSGITMTKRFSLINNQMDYEVWVENTGKDTVAWDIWTNSRFDVTTKYCIPLKDDSKVRIDNNNENLNDSFFSTLEEDCFSFQLPDTSHLINSSIKAKAYINDCKGQIIVFGKDQKLIMNFAEVPSSDIHLEQGFVEVYFALDKDPAKSLLELEHHSAYQTLAPGEKMNKKQSWILETNENPLNEI